MSEIHLIFYELEVEHVMQSVTAFVRKEKKKALTLEAIAPKWAKRLEQEKLSPFSIIVNMAKMVL